VLAGHGELRKFAQTFFETGFGKGLQGGKRLIHLALSEARSVRKPSQACNGASDLAQMIEAAFRNGFPDHATLRVVSMLQRINHWQRGLALGQIIAEMLAERALRVNIE